MGIESEYNGIRFGDKCWAWGCNESNGREFTFMGYVKSSSFPVKVIDDEGHNNGFKNARPLKTEAEKFLANRMGIESEAKLRIKALEDEFKATFDHMMRYMMFVRDNGYTTEYMKYDRDKGYE
tara:strand:+ start:24 stop:392 length:369 start_codon:yes stop_codon:yes gene_type:complete